MSPEEILTRFALGGAASVPEPFGGGHIHRTWRIEIAGGDGPPAVLLQKLHAGVFPDAAALMDNVARVTAHLRRRLEAEGSHDLARRAPALVPAADGGTWVRDEEGGAWRAFEFVAGARSVARADSPDRAFSAARAFGGFVRRLEDLPPPPLHEVLPGFHDTRRRLQALRAAAAADRRGRAAAAADLVRALLDREPLCEALASLVAGGAIRREPAVHNDTKIDNVLFDDATGEALAVVDLDTTMPGLALHDFGDLVRTAASTAPEDAADPASMDVSPALFEALAAGWAEGRGGLSREERGALSLAGRVITYECALRFLTDHLEGDRYFRVDEPGHNARRARAQLALLAALERRRSALDRVASGA